LLQDDTIDASCQLGLATLLSVTTSRRLDRLTGRDGWLNASWAPGAGLGLQVRGAGAGGCMCLA